MKSLQSRKRKLQFDEDAKKHEAIKYGVKPTECSYCSVRLRITNTFGCKCKRVFCAKHRYSDEHRCTYDYKTENMIRLEKENPKIAPSRISNA
ncbi:hypothetical protein NEAUS03_1716 [Nematocida ausubeli]|uniref:AN1-type domain-containing protein n=1 Tax=Nematocida ausubeli (strain ATCC PRA-371 / ERTm2) TaxID=1913371 RepID=A0A086J551_NEMA1|nr:uncharacterized protein NESG_00347 [Nematocida ausubeli]KAI5133003.1 hypothetical protein NEAUS07_0358 [Nematocida ausubeli]KAI5133623.1 hypothetical protein NEAUS06_0635 [Nematocida ausubeli]KAI5135545.1 hypothetical protein NEAUS07_1213 [Nematocida ausubeli]KAI5161703.1 hypothetical protein NEAUS03_1716 [Nematocida ausubeli]KFG27269.1 hypothetical protein NESG_00347 [Nematocida ausubeli]